eukprot:7347409-Heterocapsa_arctica.AAC.1
MATRARAREAVEEVLAASEAKHTRAAKSNAEAAKEYNKAVELVDALIESHDLWAQKKSDERNCVITQLDELRVEQKEDQEAQRKEAEKGAGLAGAPGRPR